MTKLRKCKICKSLPRTGCLTMCDVCLKIHQYRLTTDLKKIHKGTKYITDAQKIQHRIKCRIYDAAKRCEKRAWYKSERKFSISEKRIEELSNQTRCAKSGIIFSIEDSKGYKPPFGPSVDRANNKGDYDDENTQIVCNMYNMGKSDNCEIDFIAMCVAVANLHGNNPDIQKRLKEIT